jgi:hypothetical protein
MCAACGASDQPCCPGDGGDSCGTGLACTAAPPGDGGGGFGALACHACGASGEPCCGTGPVAMRTCGTGLSCQAMGGTGATCR